MSVLDEVQAGAQVIIDDIKLKLTNSKFPLASVWKLLQESIAKVVLLIEQKAQVLAGPDKKAAAMLIVSNIIDVAAVAIDIPFVPDIVEAQLESIVKSLLLTIASGSIDALVSTFKDTGIFPPKKE